MPCAAGAAEPGAGRPRCRCQFPAWPRARLSHGCPGVGPCGVASPGGTVLCGGTRAPALNDGDPSLQPALASSAPFPTKDPHKGPLRASITAVGTVTGLFPVQHAPTVPLLTWGSSSPWPHQPQGTEGERAMLPTSTHQHQHWDLSWSWGARDPAPGPLVARSPATAWPTRGAGARAGGQATHREPAASRGGGRAGRGAGPRPGPGLVLGSGAGTGKGSPGAGWWHRRWPGSALSPSHPGELRD